MEHIDRLEKVGFTRRQAEAQMSVLGDTLKNLATKDDLRAMKSEIFERLQLYATKEDLYVLREKIAENNVKISALDIKIEMLSKDMKLRDYRIVIMMAALLTAFKFLVNF